MHTEATLLHSTRSMHTEGADLSGRNLDGLILMFCSTFFLLWIRSELGGIKVGIGEKAGSFFFLFDLLDKLVESLHFAV
ncbi:hypothetical protein K402DRAFT_198963 [Aulographum hederae CBS 113979]|uniref:Uncharacterized protein n=1 Tax=Aulographum hederae CBS 113979 TaxID=1176131 RepID=A0A6G1HC27_9PEZI|nr:hypothetical protein K402DRAFT_198963 [Aulographum hederae CBS 113979]